MVAGLFAIGSALGGLGLWTISTQTNPIARDVESVEGGQDTADRAITALANRLSGLEKQIEANADFRHRYQNEDKVPEVLAAHATQLAGITDAKNSRGVLLRDIERRLATLDATLASARERSASDDRWNQRGRGASRPAAVVAVDLRGEPPAAARPRRPPRGRPRPGAHRPRRPGPRREMSRRTP